MVCLSICAAVCVSVHLSVCLSVQLSICVSVHLSVYLSIIYLYVSLGLPRWVSSKESACNARDPGSIPGSGRSPGGGNGNTLQYSCLETPTDGGAWRAEVYGVTASSMTEAHEQASAQLSAIYPSIIHLLVYLRSRLSVKLYVTSICLCRVPIINLPTPAP